MAAPETDISLYTAGTPNGQKISITLEELGLQYETIHVDISKNIQKEDWYLKINPNGRIPAIVDRTKSAERQSHDKRVFEGQAIMLYLCQKYDKEYKISFPFDTDKYWEVVEWMTWMQSGIGPMQTRRLYQVLEDRLTQQKSNNRTAAGTPAASAGPTPSQNQSPGPWIVGDKCTIADLACFSWVNWAEWAGIVVEEFQEVKGWVDRINERPAVKRGLDVPEPFTMKEKMKTKEGEDEYQKYHSNWVMKGQEKDQERHK